MRQALVNCNQSWLYPAGAGVYAFAADDDTRDSPFARRHLAFTRLSYQQPEGFIPEPFVLYETTAQPAPDFLENTYAAEAGTPPDKLDSSHSGQYTYRQGMEFLGASRETGASTLELVTWWRVTDFVRAEPFSIMAHLITGTGMNLSIADGLDIAPTDLRPTDVFAQRHVFELPEDIKDQELWLRTGLYQLSDLARWRIDACSGCDAIFVPLETQPKSSQQW